MCREDAHEDADLRINTLNLPSSYLITTRRRTNPAERTAAYHFWVIKSINRAHAVGWLTAIWLICSYDALSLCTHCKFGSSAQMTLKVTEAPKNRQETLRPVTCCLSLTEPCLTPSWVIIRRRITGAAHAADARHASAHPVRRCLGLGGGSGGCGRSHRIGRVQRQTCWLITEQLLSILHGAELSTVSGAETTSIQRAAGTNQIFFKLYLHSCNFRVKCARTTLWGVFAERHLKDISQLSPLPQRAHQAFNFFSEKVEESPRHSHGFHGETHGGRTAEEPDRRTGWGEAWRGENRSGGAGDDSRGIRTISATVRGGKVRQWLKVVSVKLKRKAWISCLEYNGGIACLKSVFPCVNSRALLVHRALFYASVQ